MDKNHVEKIGSALISNTMVCEVSRLFESNCGDNHHALRRHGRKSAKLRILDLFSLIEATVLQETLYTLPARLDSDTDGLLLRQKLISENIVKELDTSGAHQPIANQIIASLSNTKNPVSVAGPAAYVGTPIEFDGRNKKNVEAFFDATQSDEHRMRDTQNIFDSYDFFGEGGGSSQPLYSDNYEDMAKSLIGWIEYHGSGAYEQCTSILRDMYYIFSSEHAGMPYWPESTRIEFANKFPNYFDKAIRFQLYKKLSESMNSAISDIYDDCAKEVAFIPPFSALVLERSNSKEDIIENILVLRDEYSSLRRSFHKLEKERVANTSIKERLKLRREQRRLLESAASSFDRPSIISLEGVVRYIPEAIKPSSNPLDPTKYSANLFIQPVSVLVEWWKDRPISRIFDVADKVGDIKSYESLVVKLFSDEIESDKYSSWSMYRRF